MKGSAFWKSCPGNVVCNLEFFSKGKKPNVNEDYFGFDKNTIVLVDGVTDKSGERYGGLTGGTIISRFVVEECLAVNLNGVELVNHLNRKLWKLYEGMMILDKVEFPRYRFDCGFICARIFSDKLFLTYLGDLSFRINGGQAYRERKNIDKNNENKRAERIAREDKDVSIRDLLLKQFQYQNNLDEDFGYGVIDGTETPEDFVKTFKYDLNNVSTLELFTDGYLDYPSEISIDTWEKIYHKVQRQDLLRYRKYKPTSAEDDRSILISYFS